VSWHAIRQHYYISQVTSFLWILVLTLVPLLRNVVQWERADPPWELPNYIGEFSQALEETQAWIMTGGVAAPVPTVPLWIPLTTPTLPIPSNVESEVSTSEEELLTLKCLLPKVWLSDEVEHVLDKGQWAVTPATRMGWKIFVDVSWALSSLSWR